MLYRRLPFLAVCFFFLAGLGAASLRLLFFALDEGFEDGGLTVLLPVSGSSSSTMEN